MPPAQGECGIHIEPEVSRGEGGEVPCGKIEESCGGCQAAAVGRVVRVFALFAQMHEGSGELDESLVETRIGPGLFEPKVLQHIVRLVIVASVEAREKARIARRPSASVHAEFADKCLDAVAFLHVGKLAPRRPPAKPCRKLRLVTAAEKDSIGV